MRNECLPISNLKRLQQEVLVQPPEAALPSNLNEKGYTHKQAADNLGVSLGAIGRWTLGKSRKRANGISN